MTAGRLYCIQSWNNASETSGEQIGNRLAQSRGLHFNRDGTANTFLYSEENNEKKPTKVSLKQRILPQAARVDKLRSEAIELEVAFKAGEFNDGEYTLLRDVAFKKLRRAEELLKKAVTPVQKEEETYEDEGFSYTETFSTPSDNNGHGESYSSPVGVGFLAEVVDNLSNENLFKSFLKSACRITRKVIHYKHKVSSYLQTLKEV